MKAVILVGGPSVGTRFRPLSLDVPKPLFPIAGKPMIHHHISALSNLVTEVLLIGFFDSSIFDAFITQCKQEFPHLSIRYLREYTSLGTAGGIFHFRDEITRNSPSSLIVMNADISSSFPLADLVKFHESHTGTLSILATRVNRQIANRFGCIVADSAHKIMHYVEKPNGFISDLISCGVFVFRTRELINHLALVRESGLDDIERLRLEHDVIKPLVANQQVFVYTADFFWVQIKLPSSAILATKLCLQHEAKKKKTSSPNVIEPCYIHPSAVIHPTAKIGPNASIAARVNIAEGVRVRDSIILDDVDIKSHACILNSIVGWGSKIGQWSRLEGNSADKVDRELEDEGATRKGLKTASATILGKCVSIADETVIRSCIVLPHKELKASFHDEILM